MGKSTVYTSGGVLGRDKKVRLQYTGRTSLGVDVASEQRIGCLGGAGGVRRSPWSTTLAVKFCSNQHEVRQLQHYEVRNLLSLSADRDLYPEKF
jgi:hypothetical protein